MKKKDKQAIKFIRGYHEQYGCSPSFQEVADAIGSSKTPTFQRLLKLKDRGLVDWEYGQTRTLIVTDMTLRESALPDVTGLDAIDRAICAYIQAYRRNHSNSPSMQEVADHVGLKSTSSIRYRLVRLRAQGLVVWGSYKGRTLRVVG